MRHARTCCGAALLALLALPTYGRDTLLDASVPYASGAIAVPALPSPDDTFSFTTGTKLVWVTVCITTASELSALATGFPNQSHGEVGWRWVSGIEHALGCLLDRVTYSPAPDTVWAGAYRFPDSLLPLDTLGSGARIWWDARAWPDLVINGWVCSGVLAPPPGSVLFPYWNLTTYARSPDGSHMAFQFTTDTTALGGPWGKAVRWAVDSAGNGLFRVGGSAVSAPSERQGSQALRVADVQGRLYSLQGRAIAPSHTGAVTRPGVFVVSAERTLRLVVP